MTLARLDSAALRERICAGGEFALLDVREAGAFSTGHMLTACNLPLSRLELRVGDLVPRKGTAVALTDGGCGWSQRAAAVLDGLGYGNLAVHVGGAPAWEACGFELFEGLNVPSKAFGEIVEAACGTPSLDAAEVRRMIDAGDNVVVLDGRPWDEYREFCIPGGINCPNAELAYRVRDLVPDPRTAIVVNCAGRTRSIIGAQTLRNVGVSHAVHALRNGTIGWEWAGFGLEHGASRRHGPASADARAWSRRRSEELCRLTGVEIIDPGTLAAWRHESEKRTLYLFDVREPDEWSDGTLAGAACVEGTQLVQETDRWIAVRDARIVLIDDTGVRARMTAHWLRQMAYPDVAVLDADVRALAVSRTSQERAPVATVAPRDAAAGDWAILDLSSSATYRRGHPEGAAWGLRSRLDMFAGTLRARKRIAVLDDEGGRLAALAVADLAFPGVTAAVMEGGLAAWRAAGLPVATGATDVLCALDDVGEDAFDFACDADAAKRRYIDWELQLPGQIARDGLLKFRPLN